MNTELTGDCKLLRIFLGESDRLGHQPLYEAILQEAKKQNMAGCTVLKGILSYGASSRIHSARLIEISSDLPVVVEIIDFENKLDPFITIAGELLEKAGCGGLITVEKADVRWYRSVKK